MIFRELQCCDLCGKDKKEIYEWKFKENNLYICKECKDKNPQIIYQEIIDDRNKERE